METGADFRLGVLLGVQREKMGEFPRHVAAYRIRRLQASAGAPGAWHCFLSSGACRPDDYAGISSGGVREEVDIRAMTVWAVEQLRREFRSTGARLLSPQVDNWLWRLGQMDAFCTRTMPPQFSTESLPRRGKVRNILCNRRSLKRTHPLATSAWRS